MTPAQCTPFSGQMGHALFMAESFGGWDGDGVAGGQQGRGRSRCEQFAAGQRRSATSARTESSATLLSFWEMRIDQLRYLCQVMVIVLRNKMQMIHEPHGLLETRMQARSRKNVKFKCPQMLH